MPSRPAIPAPIERQLMIDSGWKCSIPTCGTTSALEIDHIQEWSNVEEHRYENLVVLCPTHHAMKRSGSKPRELNAKSLRIIKQNQIELAGRYGDIERRVLEHFVRNPDERIIHLPGDFDVLLMHIMDAGLLKKDFDSDGAVVVSLADTEHGQPTDEDSITIRQTYALTNEGCSAVAALREARSLS